MMSETAHTEDNVEASFEIVNPAGVQNIQQEHMAVASGTFSGAVPPPPSALPAFAQLSGGAPLGSDTVQPPLPQPSVVTPAPAPPPPASSQISAVTTASTGAAAPPHNPFSVRASGGHSLTASSHAASLPAVSTQAPTAFAPTPPSPYGPPIAPPSFPPTSGLPQSTNPATPTMPSTGVPYGYGESMPTAQQHFGLDIPFEVSSNQPSDPSSPLSPSYQRQTGAAGVWGWFNKTVSNSEFLSKMAEKAKTSVDNMLTTLDPQMKDYINPAGAVELFVATADVDLVTGVKNGFSRYFPNLVVRGVPPAFAPTVAQQPVGFDSGAQAVKDSMQALRQSGLVSQNSLVLAFNSFLAQLNSQHWYEFYCVSLSNGSNIYFNTFTQPVPVPDFVMEILKNQTPADYPQASSGFALSVDNVMTHSHGLMNSTWHMQYAGICRSELISQACVSLAYMYKSVS